MDLYPRTIQHVKTWPYLQIRCLQLCPQPNGTLSTITFDSEEVIMSHYPIENKVVNEVETNSSFTCKDESKSFGTKIVGINASKRIIRFWFQYFIEIISFYFSEMWHTKVSCGFSPTCHWLACVCVCCRTMMKRERKRSSTFVCIYAFMTIHPYKSN